VLVSEMKGDPIKLYNLTVFRGLKVGGHAREDGALTSGMHSGGLVEYGCPHALHLWQSINLFGVISEREGLGQLGPL
jgi:hypothetical protein